MAFWKKFYKSKYTGKEIDDAIGKADAIPDEYTFTQDGTERPPFASLIKTELTAEQVGALLTTGYINDIDVTIDESYTWPVLQPDARVPAYYDIKMPTGDIVRARMFGNNASQVIVYYAIVFNNSKFYMVYATGFSYNIGAQTLTVNLNATEM